ncbi:MAG: branched-chain amino acid ABC transporter permease [Pseudomonadota bacterium]|nr:branched-chain amino acid ABC transporter permease [Pseudomonadota bacterium]
MRHRFRAFKCWRFMLLMPFLAIGLGACQPDDPWQFNICRIALPGIEDEAPKIRLLTRFDEITDQTRITLHYQIIPDNARTVPDKGPSPSAISSLPVYQMTCLFSHADKPNSPGTLIGIETSRFGPVSPTHLSILNRFWLDRVGRQALDRYENPDQHGLTPDVPEVSRDLAYGLQLGINGLSRGAIYGLLALSFTLIYGLIGRINLAFGEIVMTAALSTVIGGLLLSSLAGWNLFLIVIGATAMAVFVGSGLSHLTWRNVFGPLGRKAAGGRAVIVASLGCVLFIQEFVRLVISARNFNLPPLWQYSFPVLRSDQFVVRMLGFDVLSIGMAVAVGGVLIWMMANTRFGRQWRAISQDRIAAGLCGISLQRIEQQSFVLAGFLCGITGAVMALRYGVINFHSGTLFGFKALVAAILGGIGQMRGAWLGGFVIGLTEAYWSGYFGGAYRDVAVFGLLAAILVLRPGGLLGVNDGKDSLFSPRAGQI